MMKNNEQNEYQKEAIEILTEAKTLADVTNKLSKIEDKTKMVKLGITIGYFIEKFGLIGDENESTAN